MNGAQSFVGAEQAPPLHVPPCLSVVVLTQEAAEQLVPSGYFSQAPAPLQLPSVPQLIEPWSAQLPSLVPAGTAWQVPILPGTLHDRHEPHVADAQQTPSVQWF